MKLTIIQFNYGVGGSGIAHAHLSSDPPASAFDRQPYLAIEVGFIVCQDKPGSILDSQELVALPEYGPATFLIATFVSVKPVNAPAGQIWPDHSEFRQKLAKMIGNMVCTAELSNHELAAPSLICVDRN